MRNRLVTLAFAATLALAFAGCGDDGTTTDTDTQAADTVTADVGDTMEADTASPGPIVDVVPVIKTCAEAPPLIARTFTATIRRGTHGIPQIIGTDLPNVVFGQAYAMAADHVCTMADQFVMVRSERARYFGPGDNDANIKSDFGWLALGIMDKARCAMSDMSADTRETLRAMAAGYNQYLADTGIENLPAACAGADWVFPVTELDEAFFVLGVAERASGQPLLSLMDNAAPPATTASASPAPGPMSSEAAFAAAAPPTEPLASNGWGIGKDLSENGRGMLFANPHFPWEGSLRFWESQLTIPGEMNVHGVTLLGAPLVLIGFNEHVAWTHTVSASSRFNLYVVTLDPTDPTVYVYDGERRRMSRRVGKISIKQPDGSLVEEERTFYGSHFGPMLSVAPLTWNPIFALTYRDANIDNDEIIDQWLGMDRATNFAEWKAAFQSQGGIPWVNTMFADDQGNAFYVDATPVPNFSDEALAWYAGALEGTETDTAASVAAVIKGAFGAFSFDGSRSDHEWVVAEGARDRGLIPFADAPQLLRTDYVINANDSHWLTNPNAPLVGFSPFYGPERTRRTFRTRLQLKEVAESGAGTFTGEDGKISFEELKGVRDNGRAFIAEMLRDDVVTRCSGHAEIAVGEATVPIADACDVLAAWDGRLRVDSAGAPLWRQVVSALNGLNALSAKFTIPFDADDAVATPRGIVPLPDSGPDPVLVALGTAVQTLARAGFDPDVTLGDAQYTLKGDQRIPIPGGQSMEGAANIVTYSNDSTTLLPKIPRATVVDSRSGLTEDGYLINYGSSFVMALEFTDHGPRADAILTYSQSGDPASPHFADQTALFGTDGWRSIRFTDEDIAADPELTTIEVTTATTE